MNRRPRHGHVGEFVIVRCPVQWPVEDNGRVVKALVEGTVKRRGIMRNGWEMIIQRMDGIAFTASRRIILV
jgi:hypothetical protein